MTLKNVDKGSDSLMLETSNLAADINTELLSWLYRVVVKIRADIRDAPEFNIIGGIDVAHAEKVVPESLYLFLRLSTVVTTLMMLNPRAMLNTLKF